MPKSKPTKTVKVFITKDAINHLLKEHLKNVTGKEVASVESVDAAHDKEKGDGINVSFVSKPPELPKNTYHFDVGNSTTGPIGFCAEVQAATKQEAVKLLRDVLEQHEEQAMIPAGESLGGYLSIYLNGDKVSVKDIDHITGPDGNHIHSKDAK